MFSAWLRAKFTDGLNTLWYPTQPLSPRQVPQPQRLSKVLLNTVLLTPLSWLVIGAARQRRMQRVLDRRQNPPIVIVGNMVVGGGGKTPIIVHLCETLQALGLHPAVLAHGYGGNVKHAIQVLPGADPSQFGDEAVMLAQQTQVPVYVAPTRLAAYALIKQEIREQKKRIDIVLCDDGLQHMQLPRAFEIVCFDARGVGNGLVLPAGPLREPIANAQLTDAVVAAGPSPVAHHHIFRVTTKTLQVRHVNGQGSDQSLADWAKQQRGRIHAVAGIANPRHFFDQLDAVGLAHTEHALADHAWPSQQIVRQLKDQCVLMTEKDAVKWRSVIQRDKLMTPDWYTLKIERETTPDLAELIQRTLFESKTY